MGGLSINDSVYSSLFFFLTGLHFFHLLVGLFLCCLFFWGCSFPFKNQYFLSLRVSEVHLFYNLQLFYWHFLEILWLFIFLVFYNLLFFFDFLFPPTIIFYITNEISFTIISLSSTNKFFLEPWFSPWNYYYITNYYWNLLRFTLYFRS